MTVTRRTAVLSDLTTIGVGGPADDYVETDSEAELIDAVRAADADGTPLLMIGGGSNLLVGDEGFDGVVVRDTRDTVAESDRSACAGATLTVPAGASWDEVVAYCTGAGLTGVEALSGIPGSAGATPVQNVGAYGQEVAETIASVRVWDRGVSQVRTLAVAELGFGYRTSLLKQSMYAMPEDGDPAAPWYPSPRYIVLAVTFQLRVAQLSAPVAYAELARTLNIQLGERAPLPEVRDAVLGLRAGKGMVLNRADPDTRSAGSFFTNPVLTPEDAASLPEDAPRYPAPDGRVKTSAAWLIDRAGFTKGYGLPGLASLSTKHTLALTNRGGATAADLLELARTVREGVERRFGVVLLPEPVLVGTAL